MGMDPITVASGVFSLLGMFGMFVSSKPMTVGGVVMTLALTASITQAAIGASYMMGTTGSGEGLPPSAPAEPMDSSPRDMIDLAKQLWGWVLTNAGSKAEL